MKWIFTLKSNRIITRNIYAVVMSTVLLLPLFYVCYTAFDNAKVYLTLPYFSKASYIATYNKINIENKGDIHLVCESADDKEACVRGLNEYVIPLVNSPDFMAAVALMPDDADPSVIMANRWWWPAPLLRQSEDVQALLHVSELKRRLLGQPSFDELIGDEMFDFNRAALNLILILIAINTGVALLLMYLNDKRLKVGGEPVSLYKCVSSASLMCYAVLLSKLVLVGVVVALG